MSAKKKAEGSMPRFKEKYLREVAPALFKELGFANVNEVPRLEKIVVNMGVGDAVADSKQIDAAVSDLRAITGQQPMITRARKSIDPIREFWFQS